MQNKSKKIKQNKTIQFNWIVTQLKTRLSSIVSQPIKVVVAAVDDDYCCCNMNKYSNHIYANM